MRSVLIGVFDGLQPSQITAELMPNVHRLASEGVMFTNHHPVYPTVTRINAASIVTGRQPGAHGLAANTLLVRDYDAHNVIPALEPELAKVAQRTGRVLLAPTLADILSRHGHEYVAIGVGTSGNAYVHNPTADVAGGGTIHPDFTLPYSLNDKLAQRFGQWPDQSLPNTARMAHAVRIMTEHILPERQPLVSLIWSSEPDKSQHAHGVGSDVANAAIKEADEQFGVLLNWLDDTGRAGETDILIVSDHGYSTISEVVEIEKLVRDAGFPPCGLPGGVAIAPNGGSVLFYTHDSDMETANRLAIWLMSQPWCGPITASNTVSNIPGTLAASLIGNEGERVPELAMSFAWDSRTNAGGHAGHAYSSGGAPGLGQHGSMSKHELRNTLVAYGPSFKQGVYSDTPSGNIDVAPTVLSILGLPAEESMNGRVIEEALADKSTTYEIKWSTQTYDAELRIGDRFYRQHIMTSSVGGTVYVDEGSATRE